MTKKKVNESLSEYADSADSDHEVQMARADLYNLAHQSIELHKILKTISEEQGLEGWQQAKITKAADYINSVFKSLQYDQTMVSAPMPPPPAIVSAGVRSAMSETQVADYKALLEKAKSKRQQELMGAVYAVKKGKTPASPKVAKIAKGMTKKAARDFASTKHKGIPDRVKQKNESFDFHAKQILGEGKDYQNYLELSEAPIGDVVNKIKSSLSRLPRNVAAKATQAVKSLPRSALPAAAAILMSFSAQGANAQTSTADMLDKIDALSAQISQDLGDLKQQGVGDFGMDSTTQAADVEVTRDQLKALYAKLGGGSQPTLTDLIKNGVNTDKVKNILDKMNLTDPIYIEAALQQIQGSDLLPMINWIKNNKLQEAPDDEENKKITGGRRAVSPQQAKAFSDDAAERNAAAVEKMPDFFNWDHMSRVEQAYELIDKIYGGKAIYINHRTKDRITNGPVTAIKVTYPTIPKRFASSTVKTRELVDPLKALGMIRRDNIENKQGNNEPGMIFYFR